MRTLPSLLAALVLALLVHVPPARAGTYVVRSCDNGSISGWNAGPYVPVANSCHDGGGVLEADLVGAAGEATIWHFEAPADTDIAGFSIARDYWLNATVPYGSPVYALQTFGHGKRYARIRANLSYVPVSEPYGVEWASGLTGQTSIELSVNCGGGGPCRTPAAQTRLYAAHIALHDSSDPRIEAVTGSVLDRAAVSGIRTLGYSASDRGGGVQRADLWIDGEIARTQTVDPNGGACASVAGEYALVVPCKARASNELGIDTRQLRDGRHALALRVYDATGTNRDTWSGSIVVDNVPPPVNRTAPAITGAPQVGGSLSASPGEWDGAGVSLAYRWQRFDGSWDDLRGATAATYLPRAADVGHRLRVRVTATSSEGSTAAFSESTDEVQPAAPAPSGTAAPDGSARRVHAWIVRGRRHASSATVAWAAPVTVAGTVMDEAGRPAAGELVSLRAEVAGERERGAGAARADAAGRFTIRLGVGPSRRLAILAGAARSAPLTLRVRPAVSLELARRGRWTGVAGALRGGHVPPGGVLVTVQGLRAHRWVALTTARTTAGGGFRTRVPAGTASRLRVAVPVQPGYPFAAGASAARSARSAARSAGASPSPSRSAGASPSRYARSADASSSR